MKKTPEGIIKPMEVFAPAFVRQKYGPASKQHAQENSMYCYYCGRVKHRCQCGGENSPLRRFLVAIGVEYSAKYLDAPYKRGVPPQIKRRERYALRRSYAQWYTELTDVYGERCLGCGAADDLVIDHIVPIARGGLSEMDNLQLLCKTCNRLKGKHVFDCRKG